MVEDYAWYIQDLEFKHTHTQKQRPRDVVIRILTLNRFESKFESQQPPQ